MVQKITIIDYIQILLILVILNEAYFIGKIITHLSYL